MFDLNSILAKFFANFKMTPKAYLFVSIVATLVIFLTQNAAFIAAVPEWLTSLLSKIAPILLAITGASTTKFLTPPPTVSEEMAAATPVYSAN